MACDTSQGPQGSCSAADTYQFCDMETSYELRQTCDCLCAQFGYPSQGVGPCVAGPGNDCYCADSKGSSCAMAEEGVRTCLADALGSRSAQGTRHCTDCFAECERRGYTGAPYAVATSPRRGPDCVRGPQRLSQARPPVEAAHVCRRAEPAYRVRVPWRRTGGAPGRRTGPPAKTPSGAAPRERGAGLRDEPQNRAHAASRWSPVIVGELEAQVVAYVGHGAHGRVIPGELEAHDDLVLRRGSCIR